MNYLHLTPGKTCYTTREQLYALCVLLCWEDGISLGNNPADQTSVFLLSRPKGNTGFSAYQLETNLNATDVYFDDVPSLPNSPIYFKVLGVGLRVQFNEQGEGLVSFGERF